MKLLLLVPLVFAAAGCGVSSEQSGAPASSAPVTSEETVTAIKSGGEESLGPPKTTAPPLLLVSAAGKQIATPGSSCVQYTDPDTGEGTGVCSDAAGPVHPDKLSIVHPGESLLILVAGAFVSGEGSVSVHRLGCTDKEIRTFDLAEGMMGTHTRVDLEPGAYEFDVFARFGSNDGRQGDISGSLGILVAADRVEKVIATRPELAACPFPA